MPRPSTRPSPAAPILLALLYAAASAVWLVAGQREAAGRMVVADALYAATSVLLVVLLLRRAHAVRARGREVAAGFADAVAAGSDARFAMYVRSAPVGVYVVDAAGMILDCNPMAATLVAADAARLAGRSVFDFTYGEGRAALWRDFAAARRNGRSEGEYEVRREDGAGVWLSVRTVTLPDGRLLAYAQDVTAQREAARLLRESAQRYANLFENLPDAAQVVREGRIVMVNAACVRMFAAESAQALVGRDPLTLIDPEFHQAVGEARARLAAGASVPAAEHRILTCDGRRVDVEATVAGFSDASGTGVHVVLRDVTQRKAVERALQEQVALRDQLAKTAAAVPGAIYSFRLGPDGRMSLPYSSPAIEAFFGVPSARLADDASAIVERVHPDDLASFRHTITDSAAKQLPWHHRFRAVHPTRGQVWIEGHSMPVREPDGSVLWHGYIHDVTERRRTEVALRESEAKVRAMLDTPFLHVALLDLDGKLLDVNATTIAVTEMGEEGLLGRPIWDAPWFAHDETMRARLRDAVARSASGEAVRFECTMHGPAGRVRHRDCHLQAARGHDGAIVWLILQAVDVTERVEAQGALQAHREHLEQLVEARTAGLEDAQARMRLILESAADGLYGIDVDGRVTFVNPAACALLGYTAEALIGQPAHATFDTLPAPAGGEADRCRLLEGMRGGRTLRINDTFRCRDGRALPVEILAHPMRNGDAIVGGVVSFRDDTARRAAESARERALAEAERLARARSAFVANMSHEIRTPLNAVIGYAQVGLRAGGPPRAHESFGRILEAGRHLLGVVNDVLDFAKIEAGKLAIEHAPYALGDAIDRAVDLVAIAAAARGIAFRVDESADLPCTLAGDALRVAQVLTNLLSNAVKFTPAGGRVVLVVRREEGCVVFRVADTGVGIAADLLPRLFQSFEQADDSTTRRYGGTGLGLAITYDLVERMGGTIGVETRPGQGSTFAVRLPIDAPVERVAPAARGPVRLCGFDDDEAAALAAQAAGWQDDVSGLAADATLPQALHLLLVDGAAARFPAVRQALAAARERGVAIGMVTRSVEALPGEHEPGRCLVWPLRWRHVVKLVGSGHCGAAATPAQRDRLHGLRVLAVDDNAANRVLVEMQLAAEGAQISTAENGRDALAIVAARGAGYFDLVLMDIQMPELDGFAATRQLHALDAELPVVGLTAHAAQAEHALCIAAGMRERLVKPIEADPLVDGVARHARRAPAPPVTTPPASPVDWVALAERYGQREGFVDRLVAAVLASHRATPQRLLDAAAAGDSKAIAELAHALKGTGGNLVAHELRDLARDVERDARAGAEAAVEGARRLARSVDALLASLAVRAAA